MSNLHLKRKRHISIRIKTYVYVTCLFLGKSGNTDPYIRKIIHKDITTR